MYRLSFKTNHTEPIEFCQHLSILSGRTVHSKHGDEIGVTIVGITLPNFVKPADYINALHATYTDFSFAQVETKWAK